MHQNRPQGAPLWRHTSLVVLGVLALSTGDGADAAVATAGADVSPNGLPRSDLSITSTRAIAESRGPSHFRGGGIAKAEADILAGTLKASARSVNAQGATGYAQISESITFSPLPGVIPSGQISPSIILTFNGSIDLDAESGDALDAHALSSLTLIRLDRLASPGSRTVLDRAQVLKTVSELTLPVSPSVDGPRSIIAYDTVPTTIGGGSVVVSNTSRSSFAGRLVLPLLATVGQPFSIEATINANVVSGSGYIAFADFGNTAALSIDVPTGYTFTSASGLLLTAAVPEPAQWAQLFAGVGLIGTMVVRRRFAKR